MRNDLQPQLDPVPVVSLRPTQMTVGMIEVERKRQDWQARVAKDGPQFLGEHLIPVVLGPKKQLWMIDHHHLARALIEEGVEHVLVNVVAKLDHLDKPSFLTFMDNRNWLHTFDAEGERRDYDAIPRKIAKLADDPYRSIAGAVRRAGGYSKSDTPYAEFLWADFYRRRITTKAIRQNFADCVTQALKLARSAKANHLPGWCGPE